MSQKILVIGGTGKLGEPVARQLRADGYTVRVFTRNLAQARATFGAEYEIVVGDVEDVRSLQTAMQGCFGVHINLDGHGDFDLERRGVENIARVAKQTQVERITYLSGASVVAENTWFAGTRAKLQAETALRESGVPYTIFKATFFMESLPRYVQGKRASVIGKQPSPWHWVAANDYARMVSKAYATPAAANKQFYIYGPDAYTMRQALEKYCALAQPGVAVGDLPLWMAGLIARTSGAKELRAQLPFFEYTGRIHETGDCREANQILGAPTTTLEQWAQSQM